jgi:adenosylcobyric acid synthase
MYRAGPAAHERRYRLERRAGATWKRRVVLAVRVIRLPNSAVLEEVEALAAEPDVDLRFVDGPHDLEGADMVILPGSRGTIPDLSHLRERGYEGALRAAVEAGSVLFGICGGFQMLGTELHDPEGLEGGAASAAGLGFFDLVTTFTRDRIDEPVQATASAGFLAEGDRVSGFELHGGRSTLRDDGLVRLFQDSVRGGGDCPLGVTTREYAVMGTYLHGVLADPVFRSRILEHLRRRKRSAPARVSE